MSELPESKRFNTLCNCMVNAYLFNWRNEMYEFSFKSMPICEGGSAKLTAVTGAIYL